MSDVLLTAAQMRALERVAIESGEVTGLELMERAGAGAVEAILAEWPELSEGERRTVVLCGPGNNGGDGFVVARLLRERGWEVECFLYGDAEKLPPDARVNYERWSEFGSVAPLVETNQDFVDATPNLVVDAVFGTGLSRGPDRTLCHVYRDIRTCRYGHGIEAKVVALDIPSGLCADSGRPIGACPEQTDGLAFPYEAHAAADLTVTFHARKVGHLLNVALGCCGKLVVGGLGAPLADVSRIRGWLSDILGVPRVGRGLSLVLPRWVHPTPLVPADLSKSNGHKFDHGHALVLAGGVGRGGAARLAARAALRIGAGLVTVAPPPAALIENACRLDAVMLRALRDADALAEMLADDRISALCLGPGLGLGDREASLVAAAVSSGLATVLDADALTLIARDPALTDGLHDRCVLTPHMGEFGRLAPDLADRLNAPAETGPAYSKLDAARDLAARLGATVLLKGPDTVIAEPSGRAAIHSAAYGREAPWLATAGAGDVLAGMIAGLLARGFAPMAACEAAAWLHVEAARAFGPGLIAEDLPEALPGVLRALERG